MLGQRVKTQTELTRRNTLCLPCDDNAIIGAHITQNGIGNVLQLAHSAFAILCEEKGDVVYTSLGVAP